MKEKRKEEAQAEGKPSHGGAAHHHEPGKGAPGAEAGAPGDSPHKDKPRDHEKHQAEPAAPADPKKEKKEPVDERLLRVLADFENFRKRTLREKNEVYQRAQEDLIRELLPVVDHLDLALASAATESGEAFVKGVRLISDQLLGVLQKFGVIPFDSKGELFDAARHEAIARLPAGEYPENTVVQQVRRGYLVGQRVIRPAQVVVAEAVPPLCEACVEGAAAGGPAAPPDGAGQPAGPAPDEGETVEAKEG
jgi:molecular chaperone GrpE